MKEMAAFKRKAAGCPQIYGDFATDPDDRIRQLPPTTTLAIRIVQAGAYTFPLPSRQA